MEPPRPGLSDRAGPPLLSTAAPRVRIRRRGAGEPEAQPIEPPGPPPATPEPRARPEAPLRAVLLVAALVLAIASRGDVVVLALLLGLGAGRRASGVAAAAALASAMVRWGSPSLRAIAGAQAVLGPAGWTGSSAAVASAWCAALALIGAAHPAPRTRSMVGIVAVAPFAVVAADVAVGPSVGGALGLRIVASVIAFGVASVVSRWRLAPATAVVLGVVALLLAGVAR